MIFNLVNFSKVKSLYRDGMSPMVKSTSRPVWQRTPAKNVFYYRCPDHKKSYVMSFAFAFDKEEVYQVLELKKYKPIFMYNFISLNNLMKILVLRCGLILRGVVLQDLRCIGRIFCLPDIIASI